jgi:two-component system sensor histidine kinase YesM
MDYLHNISALIASDGDVQDYLFRETMSALETVECFSRITTQFETIMDTRDDIVNLGIVGEERYIINNGYYKLNENVDMSNLDWVRKAYDKQGITVISSSHVQNLVAGKYEWVITLGKVLQNKRDRDMKAIFFADLNYSSISELCSNISLGDKGYIYVLDGNGNLIYHPQQQLLYSGLKSEKIQEVLGIQKGSFVTEDGKLYSVSTSKETGWTVVGVSYTEDLLKNSDRTTVLYLLSAMLILMASLGLAYVLSYLMEQNVEEQRQKRKSELKALQAQINPHFLYNTLDSIIWMAEWGKTKEVVLMTSSLAKLLRQSISNQNELVRVEEEVEYTRSYLTIQKMRYKDKLEYEILVNPEIQSKKIPKLVLQPLVENAIYHGIKYKEGKGVVCIDGYKEGSSMVLKVQDDGIGMNEEQLKKIFEKRETDTRRNGVGVLNVHERIQLYYGKEYGLKFSSIEGFGTTVEIRIPWEEGGVKA